MVSRRQATSRLNVMNVIFVSWIVGQRRSYIILSLVSWIYIVRQAASHHFEGCESHLC